MKNKYTTTFLVLFFLWINFLQTCEIPVFRYALERWAADKYSLIIKTPQDRALNDQEKKLIHQMTIQLAGEGGYSNVSLKTVPTAANFSSMELLFPQKSGILRPAWQGLLNEANASMIFNSPAREILRKNILNGESITWLIIESGDQKQDDDFTAKLKKLLTEATKGLKLSEEIIQMDEADKIDAMSTKKELDNLIRSSVPLRISFKTLRVSRDTPEEEVFLKMLLEQSVHQADVKEPIAIPIFGRGRCLDGVPASKLTLENLKELTKYLCSGCSCTVKAENPGVDIVMNVPWEDYISDSVMTVKTLPPLTGILETQKEETDKVEENVKASPATVAQKEGTKNNQPFSIPLLALIVIGLIGGSFFIMKK